jgi:hypothetical protein
MVNVVGLFPQLIPQKTPLFVPTFSITFADEERGEHVEETYCDTGSSVYPRGHGLKNCGELRRWEQKSLDQAEHPNERDQLEKAICENRSLRAARELIALSQTKAKHPLNNTQISEGRHIIADGTDAVTGKREGDDDLTREEVTKNQLDRLSKLLETITTRVDSVTGQVHKFDKDLYNQLTENIRAKMGHLDPADNQSFDDLVTKYRPS